MQKLRISLIVAALTISAVLAVRAVRISKLEPVTVQTPQAKVKIFNNTINNKWINVPIEITSLGDNSYRVTNKTSMGIRRFIIALYAPAIGKPAHVDGAVRHFVPVRVTDSPIAPGKSIDINIERQLREFSGSEHQHAADMSRIEMLPYVVDFDAQGKRWMGGKYLRAIALDGWEEDPDLNPKENKNLIGTASPTQGCYVYDYPISTSCLQCNTGDPICDDSSCRRPVLRFKTNRGGVGRASTCYRCTLTNAQGGCDLFGIECAHGDGSPCFSLVLDLDHNNPC